MLLQVTLGQQEEHRAEDIRYLVARPMFAQDVRWVLRSMASDCGIWRQQCLNKFEQNEKGGTFCRAQ